MTQPLAQAPPAIAPLLQVAAATLVRELPAHDELRRLRQIRALRLLLTRAAELEADD